jgi:hypothetical protein
MNAYHSTVTLVEVNLHYMKREVFILIPTCVIPNNTVLLNCSSIIVNIRDVVQAAIYRPTIPKIATDRRCLSERFCGNCMPFCNLPCGEENEDSEQEAWPGQSCLPKTGVASVSFDDVQLGQICSS